MVCVDLWLACRKMVRRLSEADGALMRLFPSAGLGRRQSGRPHQVGGMGRAYFLSRLQSLDNLCILVLFVFITLSVSFHWNILFRVTALHFDDIRIYLTSTSMSLLCHHCNLMIVGQS